MAIRSILKPVRSESVQISRFPSGLKERSLKTKLIMGLIPPVVLILILAGYLSHSAASRFIRIAVEKSVQFQATSISRQLEQFLTSCRNDLAMISQGKVDEETMRHFLATSRELRGVAYRELAFISKKGASHIFLVAKGDSILGLSPEIIDEIEPNPLTFYKNLKSLKKNEVWISRIMKIELPFPEEEGGDQRIESSVIYFGTPYDPADGSGAGYLLLSVDVWEMRNILSTFESMEPRNPGVQYSYFFNWEGWILFESEDPGKNGEDVNTDLSRSGFKGTLGNSDLPSAFKPDPSFPNFWAMVEDVRKGNSGIIRTANLPIQSPEFKEHFLAYSPVRFSPGGKSESFIYGGVAFVDRSRLTEAAGHRQIDVMFVITLLAVLVVSLVIFWLSHVVTRPILELARAVNGIRQTAELENIESPYSGYEISLLKDSINSMLATIRQQMQEIRVRDREKEIAALRESVHLEEEPSASSAKTIPYEIPGMAGAGTKIERLKSEILKAARADVDVLIIGETGTGKQLTAEAIHRLSERSGKPLGCINCGELEENLLLDTLFGHVKGAFTEAKTDRKGAFVEACGGILFLDEIQTASAGVQQALLRAISQRRIKPLGSDRDVEVDVRIIAATNADLKALVDQGKFRQDLYFRLKVLTILTPALREMKENIPVLIRHYFKQAKAGARKEKLSLSRGALEKMKEYSWPGNVRELVNCIIRAVVMAEGDMIFAEDIRLEGEERRDEEDSVPSGVSTAAARRAPADSPQKADLPDLAVRLNRRQEKALSRILEKGWVTRQEYQGIVGGDLASRTAIYDLQDLVKKGVLIREGQGPATCYLMARSVEKPDTKV